MQVLSKENWSWTLYKNESAYYLSVICGSVGIYSIEIELSKEEILEFENVGIEYIKSLASMVRFNHKPFEKRSLPDFRSISGVKEAENKWCAEKKL